VGLACALALSLPAITISAKPRGGSIPAYSSPILLEGDDPIGAALGNGERQAVGEPSIKVDSKGTVYITGADTVGRPAPAWYSNDQQQFQELPGDFRQNFEGAEGDFAVDNDDRAYMIDTTVPTLVLSRWSDHGNTLDFTEPVTVGVIPGLDDRPWLAWAKDTLWLFVNHGTHIDMYKSTDAGQTDQGASFQLVFNSAEQSVEHAPGTFLFPGHMTADNNKDSPYYGSVYVFGDCGDAHSVCSASSNDGGESWHLAEVPPSPMTHLTAQLPLQVDVDTAGNVYGVYAADDVKASDEPLGDDQPATGCDVYLTVSRDGGQSWSEPQRVNPNRRGCATFPALSAGAAGKVAVAYYQETTSAAGQDDVDEEAAWFVHVTYDLNADRHPGGFRDSIADPLTVHLGPLLRELWDFFQIDIGPDGFVHVAYSQDTRAGKDGPFGSDPGVIVLGAQRAKDVMYLREVSGPRLL
jgi:hypothetical protein